jgi:hypothetical protein
MSSTQPNPAAILQTAFSFWSSKVLLTAVEFGVFTTLAERHLTAADLGAELKLHPRGIYDFFDALVAMKFLDSLKATRAHGRIIVTAWPERDW